MTLATSLDPVVNPPIDCAKSLRQRIRSFIVRRRVQITSIAFIALIFEDLLERVRPHDLTDVGDVTTMLGLGLVLSGLGLRSFAAGILHKRTILTTSGPYALVRHPLYIGSFMMMLGFCFIIDDSENLWFVLGPMLALYLYRAWLEERTLAAQFGDQWDRYVKAVPRFLPYRWPTNFLGTWQLKQWIKNREYNAVAAVLVGLIAIQAWHQW